MKRHMKRQRGLGLLETIAALTILATGAMVLFSWIVQTQTSLQKMQSVSEQSAAKLEALAFLQTLNPSLQALGQQDFVRFQLQWRATLAEPVRASLGQTGRPDLYDVGLYQVKVQLNRADGAAWFDFEQQLVGYKPVRQLEAGAGFR